MIEGVNPVEPWEKTITVELRRKDGKGRFKQTRQPVLQATLKWTPNVIEHDFIGGATIAIGGTELPTEQVCVHSPRAFALILSFHYGT